MFLSRLLINIIKVSFLIMIDTNFVFDIDKWAQMSMNGHEQVQIKAKQVQLGSRVAGTSTNKAGVAAVETCERRQRQPHQ